jgi:deoxyribodipyrimidine photo-lyase
LLLQRHPDILHASDSGHFVWLNELIWRDFYRHLLYHFPRLSQEQNFNQKYNSMQWLNNKSHFSLWCQGQTGYPIVDAAMRQLNQTGWMHNRLRMIVASFLTKHLLIDWRWGERYFMSKLIDGDLAANNGGWQWAASTGCDAQPYFRIFNPIRQSERFDLKGAFIRKYLPELKDVPDNKIHFPHDFIEASAMQCYWPAMVDHKAARARALAFYKDIV